MTSSVYFHVLLMQLWWTIAMSVMYLRSELGLVILGTKQLNNLFYEYIFNIYFFHENRILSIFILILRTRVELQGASSYFSFLASPRLRCPGVRTDQGISCGG